MAQTPKKWSFEPWLKPLRNVTLSHGSKPKNGHLSHGSNTQKMTVWAMAQTPLWQADFNLHFRVRVWIDLVQKDTFGPEGHFDAKSVPSILVSLDTCTCTWTVPVPEAETWNPNYYIHRAGWCPTLPRYQELSLISVKIQTSESRSLAHVRTTLLSTDIRC